MFQAPDWFALISPEQLSRNEEPVLIVKILEHGYRFV